MDAADMTLWGRTSSAWSALLTQTDETNPLWPIYAPMLGARADDRPLVVGQIGQSLDGRVATDGGRRQIINGAAAMVHLHRLRALADAVVVGVGTVVADDPKLTVRDAVGANPARVIIDPAGRLPATAGLLVADGVRRMVVTRTETKLPAGV